jgi:hypothetical protein
MGSKYSFSGKFIQMSNFAIFIVGIVVTLITGMGIITSQVFMGYKKPKYNHEHKVKYDVITKSA